MYQNLDDDRVSVALRVGALTDDSAAMTNVVKQQMEKLSSALAREMLDSANEGHERSLRNMELAASSCVSSHRIELSTTSESHRSCLAPLEHQLGQLQSMLSESACVQGDLEEQYILACKRARMITEDNVACRALVADIQCHNQKLLGEMEMIRREYSEQLSMVVDRAHEEQRQALAEHGCEIARLHQEEIGTVRSELNCTKQELERLRDTLSKEQPRDSQRLAWSPIQNVAPGEVPSCSSSGFPDRSLADMSLNQARLEGYDSQLSEAARSCSPHKLVWQVLQALDVMQASLPEDIQTSSFIKSPVEQPSVSALHIHIYMRAKDWNDLNRNFMYLFV